MTCQSNLRQLYLGLAQFRDAVGNYPPYRWEDPTVVNKFGVVRPRWQWIVGDYLGRPVQNPDAITAAGTSDTTYTNVPLDNEIFFDPSLIDPDPAVTNSQSIRNGAYGYNFQYLGNSRNLTDGDVTTPMLNYPIKPVKDDVSDHRLRRQSRRGAAARRTLDDAGPAAHAAADFRRGRFAVAFAGGGL